MWRAPLLTDATLPQQTKITKSSERSQHDQTNTIQRDWTDYVVARQQGAAKLLEPEIRKKQLTGEIDWELEATRSAQNSWKDELCAIDYAEVLVV